MERAISDQIPTRRILLSPCDYHFLVIQHSTTRRHSSSEVSFVTLEFKGHPVGSRLKAALRRAMTDNPATFGRIGYTLPRARPYWQIERIDDPAQAAYRYHDFRERNDWPDCVHEGIGRAINTPWDFSRPPLIRLDHFDGPAGRACLCMQWPHALMDAEGAHLFLRELSRLADAPDSPRPAGLLPLQQRNDPLDDQSLVQRLKLFRAGMKAHSRTNGLPAKRLLIGPPDGPIPYRYTVRFGAAEDFERIKANARRFAPPGAGLYARFLAACVLRALHRLYRRHNVDTPNYLLAFPSGINAPGSPRTVTGNYVVVYTIAAGANQVEDMNGLGEHIQKQVAGFREPHAGRDQWAMFWMAGQMRPWQYRRLMWTSMGNTRVHSGFAYYQADTDPPWRHLAGAEIEGVRLGGVVMSSPGWNAVFCRYRERMVFNLSWMSGCCQEHIATEYADLVAEEALQ